ncbi:MAG: hypothetical protein JHC61_04070 [Burkholderiaceae bacterium]|nr:hypothetical protein [Burkholderiaceae bacterium]
MSKALDPSLVLHWLAGRIAGPQWTVAATVLTGMLGSSPLRARRFSSGVTVAMMLERPPRLAPEACLLLAATPEARDDSIYMTDKHLWLLRRYVPALTESELDLLFKQQQALCALLATSHRDEAAPLPVAGRYV